ncbi:TPA: SDR family oxidoreductase [Providencia stuartii]|uniref:SDR family oxidoreductase n=6 Tax=Morganellaceae TaxID=1903414 RepID=A0AAJ1N3J0_PROST|nr:MULTISPECIES: SDR family oxidoreductase [Providencia]AFH93631.1 3-ketoacyl-(acyl-carrier-protein) reductase [Providencia stuartii MRSN 2154]AIN64860.1 short chain dehydrogenase family protein [Providencia stuartii]AMG67994.1 SDR family NAD(P)-dependent oxidoreductase [Providencia stuartii]AVE41375.1 3-ketoacyl-ACP reductase [Providencia stuartii]AXO18985.1 SDR family oxidoreductase [Providencia stuartii]
MERLFSPTAFQGQVVLVTGGAQGIGLAIVEAFAQLGACVIMADLQLQKAQAAAASLVAKGFNVQAEGCDCAKQQQITALVAKIDREYHQLDVVIHNAAYFPLTEFMQIDEALLQQTLSVNLMAPFYLAQAAQPIMKRQGRGRILITSSVTGPKVAYPGLAHYAASKAGVNGFIKSAALELAPFGITVNGVEPGMIRTPAMENLGDEQLNQRIARAVPLGRLGEAEDIAAAMVFLASQAAGYMTGQTIVVDGGALLPESALSSADIKQ